MHVYEKKQKEVGFPHCFLCLLKSYVYLLLKWPQLLSWHDPHARIIWRFSPTCSLFTSGCAMISSLLDSQYNTGCWFLGQQTSCQNTVVLMVGKPLPWYLIYIMTYLSVHCRPASAFQTIYIVVWKMVWFSDTISSLGEWVEARKGSHNDVVMSHK